VNGVQAGDVKVGDPQKEQKIVGQMPPGVPGDEKRGHGHDDAEDFSQ
jgi:hypothetical protein